MRASAATMKGRGTLKAVPSGLLGELYQTFIQSSGLAVEIPACITGKYAQTRGAINRLNLFYDCDIRCVGKRKYALVGMWTDKGYIDFVANNWRGRSA